MRALGVPLAGPWRLETWIGEGRWTRVYQARPDAACDHADYAIKLLKPEHERDPVAIGLLQREAIVSREVSHPHLVPILAAHTDGPPFYLVSPFLPGATLRETIRFAGQLDAPHALWVSRQAAEAIQEMHRHGWLHNDIKPDNISVSTNGHVTVFDLGLACRLRRDTSNREVLTGTPAYVAPEQYRPNIMLTPASDVYSLGVALYEALTGRLPFPQSDPEELVAAALSQPPPDPRHVSPSVNGRVVRLLRRMLAKDPLRRPDTAELIDWLADLEIETFDDRKLACG